MYDQRIKHCRRINVQIGEKRAETCLLYTSLIAGLALLVAAVALVILLDVRNRRAKKAAQNTEGSATDEGLSLIHILFFRQQSGNNLQLHPAQKRKNDLMAAGRSYATCGY